MKRDWSAARAKVDAEGKCRYCGSTRLLAAAHTIGRKQDGDVVNPDDVVPLCVDCHTAYDRRTLDLLPYMTFAEQAAAVAHVGIEAARRRTAPSTRL